MVLAGIRVIWKVALIFAAGDVVSPMHPTTPPGTVLGAVAFVLLLLPSSRRYFRTGAELATAKPRRHVL
jgi:hypothetical protein